MRPKTRDLIYSVLTHAELVLVSLLVIIPVIWIVSSSLNPGSSLASSSLIPSTISFENYGKLFKETNYVKWFFNTLQIAIVNVFVAVTTIMLSSWVLSRFDFKGKKPGLMTILLLSMFPSFLSMTAIYTLFLTFGLLNKPIAMVIIYSIGSIPYNTWLVKGYLDGIPKSLDEAAYIDGCGRFQAFFTVTMPLSMPIITYLAVTQFMAPWMDYILPNLLLSKDENRTLAVGLFALINGKENSNFTMFAAGAVLIAIPISIIYFVFQKYLVQGISSGANKE